MTRKTARVKVLLVGGLLSLLLSCNSDLLYTDVADMPDNTWNLFNTPDFEFSVADTTMSTNIFFTLRTGAQYPFRNIFFFVTTTSPDGRSITDTLEYEVADETGRWLGKGFGDIHELKLPYRQNVFFPSKGNWHFKIQHGMRMSDLKGVYDVGLKLEKDRK